MQPLEEQTLVRRILTTVIIIIIVLLALALIGWISGGWEDAHAQYRVQSVMPGLPTTKWDSRMFALDRDAADEAYRDQMKHLFGIAIKGNDPASFDRAIVGARNLRKAYIAVMEAIDKRERESEEAK